jgi:hypothetical protein
MKCEKCNGVGCQYCGGGGEVNRTPKTFLSFDDAGASDDEPVKGVTVGDIRAWHDQYDRLLSSWAECRDLLSKERAAYTKLDAAFESQLLSKERATPPPGKMTF